MGKNTKSTQSYAVDEYELMKEFKKDLLSLSKNAPHLLSSPEYSEVLNCLFKGEPLPAKYKNHPLKNNLKGYMDCHIFNDLVLIYKIENRCLTLVRLNTHAAVFES